MHYGVCFSLWPDALICVPNSVPKQRALGICGLQDLVPIENMFYRLAPGFRRVVGVLDGFLNESTTEIALSPLVIIRSATFAATQLQDKDRVFTNLYGRQVKPAD